MAISKSINFKGIQITDAYIKVALYTGDKNTLGFSVTYHSKKDEKAFDVSEHQCSLRLDAGNPLEQAYAYLKTLPEFAGAVDC